MPQINTTREALVCMAQVTADKLLQLVANGYNDSDYDELENCLAITNELLGADYEGYQKSYLPSRGEAPWCPEEVQAFLPE